MDRTILKTLADILECIDNIESFFLARSKQFEIYKSDTMLKCAIHMNLSIIGEAVNRILKIDANFPISNARQIVNTRNYLIHGYDSLRPEMLWAIIINDLPVLKQEVISLMENKN
ncbi:MAG: DUF86 domain-containing protein [Muribaculaceae bacterium]|nr:DUF86 domain-containing protein [Muribaculaceae bacterium]